MPNGVVAPTPGMRVLCRDAEWLVTRVDPSDNAHKHYAVHCVGADDLVRGHGRQHQLHRAAADAGTRASPPTNPRAPSE